MPNTYDRGDRVRIGNHSALNVQAFKDPAGTDADPDVEIKLMVKLPNGTVLTYTYGDAPPDDLSKESTGRYYKDYDIADDAPTGNYYYRLSGTGTNVRAAEEGTFTVRPSLVLT